MVLIEAYRAFDMRKMIFAGDITVVSTSKIEMTQGNRTATFTGDFDLNPFGAPTGTLLGYRLKVGGHLVFEATGVERSASTAMSIIGEGDNDRFAAYTLSGDDRFQGSAAADYLIGFGGDDTLFGGAGNDKLFGGSDSDRIYGGSGNDLLAGGLASDWLKGGRGDDTYLVDRPGDKVIESAGEGRDLVYALVSFTLPSNVENLTLTEHARINGTGNQLANDIRGNASANILRGRGGHDSLSGGKGADTLVGGEGGDTLAGGRGNDVFRFLDVSDAGRGTHQDQIVDFENGHDRIDVSRIDADDNLSGNQVFTFLGDLPFTGVAGELRCAKGFVRADIDGDGRSDFSLTVLGRGDLVDTDFIL